MQPKTESMIREVMSASLDEYDRDGLSKKQLIDYFILLCKAAAVDAMIETANDARAKYKILEADYQRRLDEQGVPK